MKPKKYDFSGYCAVYGVKCTDGTTIMPDCFAHEDGNTVALIWGHDHDNPENTVGNIVLENRPKGLYGYGSFNGSKRGTAAREAVKHGDVDSLSIYAYRLKRNNRNEISHGTIKETSLVLKGADPTARIDYVQHDDENDEYSCYLSVGFENSELIFHDDEDDETDDIQHEGDTPDEEGEPKSIIDQFKAIMEKRPKEEQDIIYSVIAATTSLAKKEAGLGHEDIDSLSDEDAQQLLDAFDEIMHDLTPEEQDVIYQVTGAMADLEVENATQHDDEGEEPDEDPENNNNISHEDGGNSDMAIRKAYENNTEDILKHEDVENFFSNWKSNGSFREVYSRLSKEEKDAICHSVTDADTNFYPDAHATPNSPVTIDYDQTWVGSFLTKTKKTPFPKVKMYGFDITGDAARAKGYVKGHQKVEEVITTLKRTTEPQMIYKLQKLPREEILMITDFSLPMYLKGELRIKLNEEKARAALIGDGRSSESPDKIFTDKIRPIWTDSDVFAIKYPVTYAEADTEAIKLDKFITACVKSREDYKGAGATTCYTTEGLLSDLLLLKDGIGHRLYANEGELATAIRCANIQTVPQMVGQTRVAVESGVSYTYKLLAIIVNPTDYTFGSCKGGEQTSFEDFDLNYNTYEYLLEEMCSGALTVPHSAIVIEQKYATPVPPEGGDN